jgi:hypothetical protein
LAASAVALDTGNATIALAAAAELDFVSLPDALEIVSPPGRGTLNRSGVARGVRTGAAALLVAFAVVAS